MSEGFIKIRRGIEPHLIQALAKHDAEVQRTDFQGGDRRTDPRPENEGEHERKIPDGPHTDD